MCVCVLHCVYVVHFLYAHSGVRVHLCVCLCSALSLCVCVHSVYDLCVRLYGALYLCVRARACVCVKSETVKEKRPFLFFFLMPQIPFSHIICDKS